MTEPQKMMNAMVRLSLVAAGLMASQVVLAQAPAGSTGQCKDGTYTTAATKSGACRGHQGIKDWYAAAPAAAPAAAKSAAAPAAAAPAASTAKAGKAAPAAAPAPVAAASGPAPAGSTGQCKDGTYTNAASKMGACRGHQGVKDWYAASAAPAAATAAKAAPAASAPMAKPAPAAAAPAPAAPAPAPMAKPAATAAPAVAAAKPSAATPKGTSGTASAPAPGGGPGMVWVNLSTKVYHCQGSRYYGTTKDGKYMSEADAKAAGARPDHNTPCSK